MPYYQTVCSQFSTLWSSTSDKQQCVSFPRGLQKAKARVTSSYRSLSCCRVNKKANSVGERSRDESANCEIASDLIDISRSSEIKNYGANQKPTGGFLAAADVSVIWWSTSLCHAHVARPLFFAIAESSCYVGIPVGNHCLSLKLKNLFGCYSWPPGSGQRHYRCW